MSREVEIGQIWQGKLTKKRVRVLGLFGASCRIEYIDSPDDVTYQLYVDNLTTWYNKVEDAPSVLEKGQVWESKFTGKKIRVLGLDENSLKGVYIDEPEGKKYDWDRPTFQQWFKKIEDAVNAEKWYYVRLHGVYISTRTAGNITTSEGPEDWQRCRSLERARAVKRYLPTALRKHVTIEEWSRQTIDSVRIIEEGEDE